MCIVRGSACLIGMDPGLGFFVLLFMMSCFWAQVAWELVWGQPPPGFFGPWDASEKHPQA